MFTMCYHGEIRKYFVDILLSGAMDLFIIHVHVNANNNYFIFDEHQMLLYFQIKKKWIFCVNLFFRTRYLNTYCFHLFPSAEKCLFCNFATK